MVAFGHFDLRLGGWLVVVIFRDSVSGGGLYSFCVSDGGGF